MANGENKRAFLLRWYS